MEWQLAYTASNALEAYSLKGMLEHANIEVTLRGEFLAAAAGELPANVVEVGICVQEPQLQAAKRLLHTYEHQRGLSWRCPACQESNGGNFELCWQCGSDRV